MSVFLLAQITITDREEYASYEAGFGQAFAGHGAKVLSATEQPEVLEGTWAATRTVVIEFPDRERALGWYHSPAYQAIIGHRHAASTGNVVLVDRFEVPPSR